MNGLLPELVRWSTDVAYSFGYVGIAVLVALGNMHLPIPTEITLPLAGFLVGQGRFSFVPVLVASTVGGGIASLVMYLADSSSARRTYVGSSGVSAGSRSWRSRTWTGRARCSSDTVARLV